MADVLRDVFGFLQWLVVPLLVLFAVVVFVRGGEKRKLVLSGLAAFALCGIVVGGVYLMG